MKIADIEIGKLYVVKRHFKKVSGVYTRYIGISGSVPDFWTPFPALTLERVKNSFVCVWMHPGYDSVGGFLEGSKFKVGAARILHPYVKPDLSGNVPIDYEAIKARAQHQEPPQEGQCPHYVRRSVFKCDWCDAQEAA